MLVDTKVCTISYLLRWPLTPDCSVLLLNEPLDEIFVQNVRQWKKIKFQDIAKTGLKFGDEGMALFVSLLVCHSHAPQN